MSGEEEATIVGCLCTPLDRLADDVALPRARPGDLVAVFLAGAYGLSASPQAFLAQRPAVEMVVDGTR
jgi:diaminopimelate decarboxylase